MTDTTETGREVPLVVDLDGTLIKTDLLHETASAYVTSHPLQGFRVLSWLMQGKAVLKEKLAQTYHIDPHTLPYAPQVLDFARAEKARGRTIILATASHHSLADPIAAYLGLFDEVLATDAPVNLKGETKRAALVEKYGEKGFDYIGDTAADLVIWQAAHTAHVVGPAADLVARVKGFGNLGMVFDSGRPPSGRTIIKALRLHQWVKNLLVFVPLMTAHLYTEPFRLLQAGLAFLVFGMTASSVYLLNDIIDVGHDRHHQRKKKRPFAAGDLSIIYGWQLFPLLLAAAAVIAWVTLPHAFLVVMAAYFIWTLAYSLGLKQIAMLDVLSLAGLYTVRIIAGGAAVSVSLSFWLLTFSMFLFLSLAFIKRFSELQSARLKGAAEQIRGRGYVHEDLEIVSSLGSSSGYMAVLVLALYIQDGQTAHLYQTPQFIWLACPLLLYWMSRVWIIAHRGRMHDDPIVFALKDPVSWAIGALFVVAFALARLVG